MKNIKKFVGEYAYNIIKNFAIDVEAIKKALVTPQNARNIFSELDEYQIKSLCTEISHSGTIGSIRNTTQEEIINVFNSVGYDTIIFDDEDKIEECRKYYKSDERICTYNDLQGRMREYNMLVALKADIDKIERSTSPQRDDEYGTSILNIQIARNGSHMSIKNRYNHTVSQPDSTLNNDLNCLYMGLQNMVLGYYGFASLSSNKSHYSNIVNIGGVYLKYHTEKNNVYFGDFVLDGVNGVRFTDKSRYYVGKGNDNDRYFHTPLVLDFQNKQTIDITEHKKVRNGKAILLSKAMQNGVLTSGNKTEYENLSVTFYNAKKELLNCNKNALKYVHEEYGYDFTKPHNITGFLGKFTAKSIEKITKSNNGILLVYAKNELKVCEMNCGKFNARDLKGNYNYGINIFYTQGNFEAARKSGNKAIYVIQQDKQHIGKPRLKNNEGKIYYGFRDYGKHEFDKSGCNLTEVRFNLSQRLAKYKAEKQAKLAAELDYTKDVVNITELFAELKLSLVELMTNAETQDDYNILDGVIGYKLTWLVRDIESFKRHVNNKTFSSSQEANNKVDSIKNTIAELRNKI